MSFFREVPQEQGRMQAAGFLHVLALQHKYPALRRKLEHAAAYLESTVERYQNGGIVMVQGVDHYPTAVRWSNQEIPPMASAYLN